MPAASPIAATGARAVPIYQSTSFVFEDTADAADLFALQKYGTIYTRISQPDHGGVRGAHGQRSRAAIGSVATSSGQAAEFMAITTLAGAGDHIVAAASIYGGTYTLLATTPWPGSASRPPSSPTPTPRPSLPPSDPRPS